MKQITVFLSALLLTGCAGLSINADFYGSYRSDVPMGGRSDAPKFQLVPTQPKSVNPGLKL